jgi:hypothetical protein
MNYFTTSLSKVGISKYIYILSVDVVEKRDIRRVYLCIQELSKQSCPRNLDFLVLLKFNKSYLIFLFGNTLFIPLATIHNSKQFHFFQGLLFIHSEFIFMHSFVFHIM